VWKSVREKAAELLGEIGDKRAVEPLITALKDGHLFVRQKAAEALGEMGDERAIKLLKEVAQNDSGSHVREAAKEALEKIQEK